VTATATLQARMGSSRLPGKVMLPILGRPMIELQIERIRRSRLIDRIVLATSTRPLDDPLEELGDRLGVGVFRGSEEDLLSRIAGALRAHGGELHVELFGDSPLPDPALLDEVIRFYLDHTDRLDVVTNALTTTYPPGLEVTVYPCRVLFDAERNAHSPEEREHVSVAILRHPERYRIRNLEAPPPLRRPEIYLEVDTAEDFEVISAVYEQLYPQHPEFGLPEILAFLDSRPELAARNRHVERRWMRYRQQVQA